MPQIMRQLILMLLFPCIIVGQKIKVKKGKIWLDKYYIGTVQKPKKKKYSVFNHLYEVYDRHGIQRYVFRHEYVLSKLYNKDKRYFFYTIQELESNRKASIVKPHFYLSKKQIANFLIDSKLLTKSPEASHGMAFNTSLHEGIPEDVKSKISREKTILEFVNFKIDRYKKDPVYVFFKKTVPDYGSITTGRVTKSIYSIVQGVKDPKTNDFISMSYIGYAVAEEPVGDKIGWTVNPPRDYRPHPLSQYSLIVYNTKDVPLASYRFLTYKHYHPYKEYRILENPLNSIESVEGKIHFIARDLIKREKM